MTFGALLFSAQEISCEILDRMEFILMTFLGKICPRMMEYFLDLEPVPIDFRRRKPTPWILPIFSSPLTSFYVALSNLITQYNVMGMYLHEVCTMYVSVGYLVVQSKCSIC